MKLIACISAVILLTAHAAMDIPHQAIQNQIIPQINPPAHSQSLNIERFNNLHSELQNEILKQYLNEIYENPTVDSISHLMQLSKAQITTILSSGRQNIYALIPDVIINRIKANDPKTVLAIMRFPTIVNWNIEENENPTQGVMSLNAFVQILSNSCFQDPLNLANNRASDVMIAYVEANRLRLDGLLHDDSSYSIFETALLISYISKNNYEKFHLQFTDIDWINTVSGVQFIKIITACGITNNLDYIDQIFVYLSNPLNYETLDDWASSDQLKNSFDYFSSLGDTAFFQKIIAVTEPLWEDDVLNDTKVRFFGTLAFTLFDAIAYDRLETVSFLISNRNTMEDQSESLYSELIRIVQSIEMADLLLSNTEFAQVFQMDYKSIITYILNGPHSETSGFYFNRLDLEKRYSYVLNSVGLDLQSLNLIPYTKNILLHIKTNADLLMKNLENEEFVASKTHYLLSILESAVLRSNIHDFSKMINSPIFLKYFSDENAFEILFDNSDPSITSIMIENKEFMKKVLSHMRTFTTRIHSKHLTNNFDQFNYLCLSILKSGNGYILEEFLAKEIIDFYDFNYSDFYLRQAFGSNDDNTIKEIINSGLVSGILERRSRSILSHGFDFIPLAPPDIIEDAIGFILASAIKNEKYFLLKLLTTEQELWNMLDIRDIKSALEEFGAGYIIKHADIYEKFAPYI